jgi:hypothetical protein
MNLLKRIYKQYLATIWLTATAICFSFGVQPEEPLTSRIFVYLFPIAACLYEHLTRKPRKIK